MLKKITYLKIIFVILLVASCSQSGNNSASSTDSTVSELSVGVKPDPVKDLKATYKVMSSGNWQLTLTWTSLPNIKSYSLKRGLASGVYDQTYADIKSPYTISDLKPGSVQYFIILSTATVNNTDVVVTSSEYSITIPIDAYTEKPGEFSMAAVAGDSQVTLTWEKADRATFFVIQSGTNSGSYPTVVARLATSPYVDKGLKNGEKRYYIVIAVNSVGSTNSKSEVAATPLPAGTWAVSAAVSDSKLTLTWPSLTGAASYIINRGTASGVYDATPVSSSATSPYIDSGLTNGTTYYYKVTAVNDKGDALSSYELSAIPRPLPGSFAISSAAATNGGVNLSWQNSSDATSYTVQYGTSPGSYPFTSSSSATSSHTITGLSNGSIYYFMVIAVNEAGSTNATGEISQTPQLPRPGVFNISSATPTNDSVSLAWTSSTDAETYTVQYGTDTTYPTTVSSSATSPFVITGLTIGNTYYFRVIASNAAGTIDATSDKVAVAGTWSVSADTTIDTVTNVFGSTMDPSANVYVTGCITNSDCPGFYIAKYNSSGVKQWTSRLVGQNIEVDPYSTGITSDISSNIYITGTLSLTDEQGQFDGYLMSTNVIPSEKTVFITKYNSFGVKQWTQILGEGPNLYSFSVATDPKTDVYLVGTTNSGLDGNTQLSQTDLFIAKYDRNGAKQWIKQFGGGSGSYVYMWGNRSIVTDSASNLYITGSMSTANNDGTSIGFDNQPIAGWGDYFLAKFSSDGTKQWVKEMGDGIWTAGYAVTLDASSNIYVAGEADGSLDGNTNSNNNACDIFIAKYNSEGTKQWTIQEGGGGCSLVQAIAADLTGHLFISGATDVSLADSQQGGKFLIRHDAATGLRQSTVEFGSYYSNVYDITAINMLVSDGSNIYLTGSTDTGMDGNIQSGAWDLFVKKYDASGLAQWTQQLGSITTTTDVFHAPPPGSFSLSSVVPSSSEVSVTWTTSSDAASYTVQYGTDTTYSSTASTSATSPFTVTGLNNGSTYYFKVIATNSGGTSYATSDAVIMPAPLWPTVQFGASGSFANTFEPNGLTVDGSGNIIATGYTGGSIDGTTHVSGSGNYDLFVKKYSSVGEKLWTRQEGNNGDDSWGYGVTSTAAGDVYVTGLTRIGVDGHALIGENDSFIIKYNSSGTKQWSTQFGDAYSYTTGHGLTTDDAGNVYVVGESDGTIMGAAWIGWYDLFVSKYDSVGNWQWTQRIGVSSKQVAGCGVVVDPSYNVYVTGYTNTTLPDSGHALYGSRDMFIAKFDSSGTKQWTRQLGSTSVNTYARSIAIDKNAPYDLYITGESNGTLNGVASVGNRDAFLTKYSTDGNLVWVKQLGVSGSFVYGNSVIVDSASNIYISGYTFGGIDGNTKVGSGTETFVTKYDNSGTKQWTHQFGLVGTNLQSYGIAVDASNNIYLSGYIDVSGLDGNILAGNRDTFIMKLNSDGIKQ